MILVKGIIKKNEDTFVDYLLKLDNGNTIVTKQIGMQFTLHIGVVACQLVPVINLIGHDKFLLNIYKYNSLLLF